MSDPSSKTTLGRTFWPGSQAAREHDAAWRAGYDFAREQAARVARQACLVPPDGGSPSPEEVAVCDEAERRIRAMDRGLPAMSDRQETTANLPARLRARAEGRELNRPLYFTDMAEAADRLVRLEATLRYLLAFPGATEAQRRAREALGND